jgi:hypothetical protein
MLHMFRVSHKILKVDICRLLQLSQIRDKLEISTVSGQIPPPQYMVWVPKH